MIKDIGKRIKTIRESKNLNAKNIADKVGILDTSLSKIERAGTNSVETLLKIAKALDVSPCEFFEEKTKPNIKETKSEHGFATKDDFLSLVHTVQLLTKQIEKLRDELPKKKAAAKKKFTKK